MFREASDGVDERLWGSMSCGSWVTLAVHENPVLKTCPQKPTTHRILILLCLQNPFGRSLALQLFGAWLLFGRFRCIPFLAGKEAYIPQFPLGVASSSWG